MGYKTIDLSTYARRQHFEYFSSLQYPYVGLTCDVDVTDLVDFCKREKVSFYLTFMHVVALSADKVSQLRMRIRKGEIVEFDECPTSHTELREDGTYCYCTLHHHLPFDEYIKTAENERDKCRKTGSIEEGEEAIDKYFVSTVPWLNYSALVQPVAGGEDSNPRITWGKYQEDFKGRLQMPLTVLAHHGLVDGIHIAEFYDNIKKQITEIVEKENCGWWV